jgi:zinc protease
VNAVAFIRTLLAGAAAVVVALAAASAQAVTIERVVSPAGIEAWLVRNPALPMVALEFAVAGGADQDPADKAGLANLAASTLDEGAGPLAAVAFHDRLESKAIEISFSAGREQLRGTLRTLTENREEAFDLLRLALTAPRFDAEAVERMRAQTISRLKRESVTPNEIARKIWWETAFPAHPYGRPVNGTPESIARISADDMRGYIRRVLARERLKIAIVGDIDAKTAGELMDRTFGSLPAKGELATTADVVTQGLGRRIVIQLDVPQAAVAFGGSGISRSDPEFMAAYIVNHVLGGGSLSSRLYREVREKRGLAYGISDTLLWFNGTAVWFGATATRANATAETIDIIGQEVRRLAQEGPTEEEFVKAKTYLKGSFALVLDSSSRIATQLIQMQLDNLGIDYIDRRAGLIDAVTLADAKRVARRLLEKGILVTVVGRPQGVSSSEGG